jgi:CRP/FNR family transcriptional regulator
LNPNLDVEKTILACPLFAALPREKVKRLVALSKTYRFKAGQYIWHTGDSPRHLCLVVAGLLKTTIVPVSGKTSIIELVKPGEICGCIAHLHGGAAFCDLKAVTDTEVVCVPAPKAFEFGADAPGWFRALAVNISRRFTRQIKLRLIVTSGPRQKIPALLLWLSEKVGATISLTQAVIAMVAGINEATVCRALVPLKRRNLIKVSRGVIEILDCRALEAYLMEMRLPRRSRRR